jgi:methionine-rich copper-binding protein CopC
MRQVCNYVFYVILVTTLIMFHAHSAIAYNIHNDSDARGIRSYGGHEEITQYAIDGLTYDPILFSKLDSARDILKNAVANEDMPAAQSMFHFYNPATQLGLYGTFLGSAKVLAKANYDAAYHAYILGGESGTDTAWSRLGHTLHLLQDMSAPSHVQALAHYIQAKSKTGYEWWVTENWDKVKKTMDGFLEAYPSWRTPSIAGTIGGLMDAVANRTYADNYPYDVGDWIVYPDGAHFTRTVSPSESEHNASFLIPQAVRSSGTLFKMFCMHVNCTGTPYPPPSNERTPAHPDDNFDVSSRLIELEELDVTKQTWKDLYGRTGIKKGYNGLFLEKTATEAYARLVASTTEADYNVAAQQFQTVITRAQKEAKHSFEDTYYASADVALLSDAFVDNAAELLLKRLKEPIREVKETLNPAALLKNQPVLLVPSGALTGFNDSPMLKASLDEYVKSGGTLIVLSQKHGYDYASIPTPDGKPLTGYGWEEDQNCFADSVAIENWHQMFSGQSRSTPTVNVDGYFTGYPANATVMLRRTANGQPALLMYEHGQGRVIVTSMYSDWAYGHGQASQEEIAIIRDLLSWVKKPATLPEVKPGEAVSLPVTLTNSTATDAATIKLQIWNPDRTALLSEQTVALAIPAGQSLVNNVSWQVAVNAALGIYHIDYLLLDAAGTIIQPQAETDSGRLAVSNPPRTGTVNKDIWLSITSPNQEVFFGEPFAYTFHVFNTTATPRTLTLRSWLPHTNRWHEWPVTATPNGETTISGSDLFLDTRWMFETLRAYLYDESGKEIGSYMLSFKGVYPNVAVTTSAGKDTYTRGETVNLSVNLKNTRSTATAAKLTVTVTDPSNLVVSASTQDVSLAANGTTIRPFSFPLSASAQGGLYTISTEVADTTGKKVGGDTASFTIPLRFVTVAPTIPSVLNPGPNTVSFALANLGTLPVSAGALDTSLKDPDGAAIAALSQPFTLDAGQGRNIDFPVSVPPLKFGSYTISYTQNDETRTGKSTTVALPNGAVIAATFDKPSYRIRETANLALTLTNSGRFNLDNLSVAVVVPDAGYADTRTVTIGQGQTLPLQQAIPIPDTIAAGQHTVTVTLTLPGGSAITKAFTITVPDSLLAYSLAQSSVTAGGTLAPTITNSGGKDTQAEYILSLYDARSALIATKSATEPVQAGAPLALALPIPVGATDGSYTLVANYKGLKTGKNDIIRKPVTIAGVKGALALTTGKPMYLNTESITGLGTITNLGTPLTGGILHLQVTTAAGRQQQKTWTSQFDFQQGVRSGVDTYGVNDWLIPDDDFDSTTLDLNRWNKQGNVSVQAGKLFMDCAAVQSAINSAFQLAGDFDIQIDFSENNSQVDQGAEIAVYWDGFYSLIKNTRNEGYLNDLYNNGQLIGGYRTGSDKYSLSGRFRIVRTGMTVITYYLENGSWRELYRYTFVTANNAFINIYVWRGQGYSASAKFDNFKVNSGRIVTKKETVDSVRLLPLNDNFDDGVVNEDRWQKYGLNIPVESSGMLHLSSNVNSGENGVVLRSRLPGDFRTVSRFKNYAASPYEAVKARYIMEAWSGNSGFYMNRYSHSLSRSGGQFLVGISNINEVYVGGSDVPYTSDAGKFRLRREGVTGFTEYWDGAKWITNHSRSGMSTGTSSISLYTLSEINMPTVSVDIDIFSVEGSKYAASGTLSLKHDSGIMNNKWREILFSSTVPLGATIKFRTRTAATEAGLASATWSDYLTASGSPITSPPGRWVEVEATLSTTDTNITPLLHDITVTYGNNPGDILWQTDVPLNLAQGAVSDFTNNVGTLGNAGKCYLQGSATSSTGQTVATYEYPFFVAQGNTALSVSPDKRVYKPGETVTISGEVKNLAAVTASNLSFVLKSKASGGTEQTLFTDTFSIPAGGSHPFTVTTTVGTEGTITLIGAVTQGTATLAQTDDQYEVAIPQVTAVIILPDMAGNDPFTVNVEIRNDGKTDASVSLTPSITSQSETVTVSAGQKRLLQYIQQITADALYTFVFSGDLAQTVTKTVKYGLGGSVSISPQAIYPEGEIAIPAAITSTGLLDGQFNITWQLTGAGNTPGQQAATYYIPKGGTATDTLSFDLAEGSYQLTATGQQPALAGTTSFSVRKEVKADLTMTVGAQSGMSLPVTTSVTNLGFSPIEGTIRLSLVDGSGTAAWSSSQDVSLPQALVPSPQSLPFAVNLAAIRPGNYTIRAELLDAGNRQLAAQSTTFTLNAPTFVLTQLPPYQTVPAGGEATMAFRVKNSGNQEGAFDLSFKADDLLDATRTEWLKPGEEKEIAFSLQTATDLEEKDYFAAYTLRQQGLGIRERGMVKYHVSGINIEVVASLDKTGYREGESAVLTLTVTDRDGGIAPNIFARVNYAGYEEKREFTLNGSQTLSFAVPLSAITGEKLFYGIYHQSGRSIHLNTIYIHKADGLLTVTTDKQVYLPGETVSVSLAGSAAGDLSLTGPGDFRETFAFAGSATRSFVLPDTMTAGTYTLSYTLADPSGGAVSGASPFDVAGIQVKVKEALLDKARYTATDTMDLSLTIESNRDLPATVKTWVVDPAGTYTPAGEGSVNLTAASPLPSTVNSQLSTAFLGIHKLVYGIYKDNLLLASGAKAFDIGEAVLLGLATDKTDYPEITSPVTLKADLYGATEAALEFILDGTSITTDTVTIAGVTSYTLTIPPAGITPGRHTLKAVLTFGGLSSTRETSFTYGSNLPDLTVRVTSAAAQGSSLNLTATVGNQGKTASAVTSVALYDGDSADGGKAIGTLTVPPLEAGATVTLGYAWNVLGKAGDYVVSAVVDPADVVKEFVEANNKALTAGSLPDLALGVSTAGSSFRANADVGITANYANLSASSPYQDLVLRVELSDPQGATSVLKEATIAALAPATTAVEVVAWNTTTSLPGNYIVTARLIGGGGTVAIGSTAFAVEPTLSVIGTVTAGSAEIKQGTPLTVSYTLNNRGNVTADGIVTALVIDPQSGAIKASVEQSTALPVHDSMAGELSFPSQNLELKSYRVELRYASQEDQFIIANAPITVKDGIPPVVTALSPQPDTAHNSTLAIVVIAADEASGMDNVEFQVDDGAWNVLPVENPATGRYATAWTPLATDNGRHTVRFRGNDLAGNASAPVPVTFTIDTVPPLLTISTLGDGAYTSNDILNIAGTVHDNLGGGELKINDVTVPVNADGSFSYAFVLQSGANTVTTVADDLAKNRALDERTITMDQSAPVLTISVPADNSKTGHPLLEVRGTVNEDATVEVKAKDRVQSATMDGTAFTATVGLDPGLNTIEITARDLASNPGTQKRTVLYDDRQPSLSVTEPNQDIRTNRNNITVSGAASDPYTAVGVTVAVDGTIMAPPVVNGIFSQVVALGEEKLYPITVTAINEVGTQTSVQRNVIYDHSPPNLTIAPVSSPTNTPSQTVTGTREEGVTVTVTCATATVGAVEYPATTSWRVPLAGLQLGENRLQAETTDLAGNRTTAAATILYAPKAPDVTTTVSPQQLWPPNKKLVPVTIDGKVVTYGTAVGNVAISVADEYGKYTYTNLKFGDTVMLEAWRDGNDLNGRVYTITAVATDLAGNTTTKTTTVVVPHDMAK